MGVYELFAMGLLASINTGGGAGVEGDAKSGRDFTGRDSVTFNNWPGGEPPREPRTDNERIDYLMTVTRGDPEIGVIGLLERVRNHDFRLTIGLIIVICLFGLNLAMFITLIVIMRSII